MKTWLAYDRPGWVLVSTYSGGDPDAFTWMDDQVFVLELKAGRQAPTFCTRWKDRVQ